MSRFLIFLLLLTQCVATMSQPSDSVSSSSSAPSSPYVATLSQPSWEQLFRDWLTT